MSVREPSGRGSGRRAGGGALRRAGRPAGAPRRGRRARAGRAVPRGGGGPGVRAPALPGRPAARARLEALVRARPRARSTRGRRRRASLWAFMSRGYWRRLAERPAIVLAAWLCLLVPAVAGAAWGLSDAAGGGRDRARAVPGGGRPAGRGARLHAGRERGVLRRRDDQQHPGDAGGVRRRDRVRDADRAGARLQRADAGGARRAGVRRRAWDRVPAPGVLARAAGDHLRRGGRRSPGCGWAGRSSGPGPRRRGAALRAEARPAVEIAAGTVPWLVVCGLCEGFLTGTGAAAGACSW